MSFLRLLGPILSKIVLTSLATIPELEFLYLRFSFQNLFLNFFQAFSEVSVVLKKFVNLGSWVLDLCLSIPELFMVMACICILAVVT